MLFYPHGAGSHPGGGSLLMFHFVLHRVGLRVLCHRSDGPDVLVSRGGTAPCSTRVGFGSNVRGSVHFYSLHVHIIFQTAHQNLSNSSMSIVSTRSQPRDSPASKISCEMNHQLRIERRKVRTVFFYAYGNKQQQQQQQQKHQQCASLPAFRDPNAGCCRCVAYPLTFCSSI